MAHMARYAVGRACVGAPREGWRDRHMLRGKKVVLRPVEREDLKRLHELSQDVDLALLAGGAWEPWSLAAEEKEFDKHLEDQDKADFVIEADGKVIGDIGLHRKRNRRSGAASLGVSIFDRDYL